MKKEDLTGKTITNTYTNEEMLAMLNSIEQYLEIAKGKFGYAIARNTRKIKQACNEFLQIQNDLIVQFGEPDVDEEGNQTGYVKIEMNTPAYDKYMNKIKDYLYIKHNVEIYQISYDVLPDDITAGEMLKIEWMLYDGENQDETPKIIK